MFDCVLLSFLCAESYPRRGYITKPTVTISFSWPSFTSDWNREQCAEKELFPSIHLANAIHYSQRCCTLDEDLDDSVWRGVKWITTFADRADKSGRKRRIGWVESREPAGRFAAPRRDSWDDLRVGILSNKSAGPLTLTWLGRLSGEYRVGCERTSQLTINRVDYA